MNKHRAGDTVKVTIFRGQETAGSIGGAGRSQRPGVALACVALAPSPACTCLLKLERRSLSAIISEMPDVEWIRKLCLSFPDVTEDMPWGDDLCFKVRGKIFAGMVLSDGRFPRITLKCAPKIPRAARDRRYLPRALRRTLQVGNAANSNVLSANELESLIRQSYDVVVAKAPKRKAARKKAPRNHRKN